MLKRVAKIFKSHPLSACHLKKWIKGLTGILAATSLGLVAGCNDTAFGPMPQSSSTFSYDGTISATFSSSSANDGVIGSVASSSEAESSSETSSTSESDSSSISSVESSSASSMMPEDFTDPDNNTGIVYNVTIDDDQIPARGSTKINVSFTDVFGNSVNLPSVFDLTATSPCIIGNTADIELAKLTSQGIARITYEALAGCIGDDLILFTGDWNGAPFSFERLINIEKELISSIEWVNTEPQQISIRGSGSQENAVITFRLRGSNDEPIIGDEVSFEVIGATGSLSLADNSAISDSSGLVKVEVRAGTAPSSVTILATHVATGFSAPSSSLIVASGVPVQGNVSLAVDTFSIRGFDVSGGTGANFTVSASDKSGNPVPDGISVLFSSEEGGNIGSQCIMKTGSCSTRFVPTGVQPPDGRVQILATMKGSEGFTDYNGNKVFDDGDVFDPAADEKGEPFSDNNNNGEYDLGETYIDTNNDGMRTAGNGLWSGPNCQHSSLCDPNPGLIDIGVGRVLILAQGDNPELCNYGNFPQFDEILKVAPRGFLSFNGLYLSDGNLDAENGPNSPCALGNPLPAGTQITFSVTEGSLQGANIWSVPRDTYQVTGPYSVNYKAPNESGQDILMLRITPPGGGDTIFQWSIKITTEVAN